MTERWFKIRIWAIAFGLMGFLTAQGAWLAYLQLGDHSRISRDWSVTIEASRGGIYDTHGRDNPLAVTVPGKRVFLDPHTMAPGIDRVGIAEQVAELLDLDTDVVLFNLNREDRRYLPLAICLEDDTIEHLRALRSAGVHLEDIMVRYYPLATAMAHVLGFVNAEGIGSAGIEHRFHDYLTGSSGLIEGKVDGRRREIYRERGRFLPAIAGADIFLTLDQNIQHVVERAMEEALDEFHATAAWAIVQKVRNGEILAMAARPSFDPNRYAETSRDMWRNRPIQTVFEPGSTMKALVVAAALNEGLITPETRFDVGAGVWFYGGHPLRDHVRGDIDVVTLIKKSSNIGAARIGLMLGDRRLETYLRAFGFGSRLGIDLPGEERGILAPANRWSKISPTRLAIGQGIAVTALQMLNLYATLANDGVMMRPHVVRRIQASNGEVIFEARPEIIGRPVTPAVARLMREMLMEVTMPGGTATRAATPPYRVGGKTGTAQIPVGGRYSNTDYWASFVGFLPGDDPEIAIIVVVERPQPQRTGGYVAAPVFGRIAETVAHYLALAPSAPRDPDSGRLARYAPSLVPEGGRP